MAAQPYLVPTVTAEQVLGCIGPRADGKNCVIIDLRTPDEFAEDHIPGAINLPLFRNEERALIGTLYKQESPQRSFDVGREIVSERIAELFEAIGQAVGWSGPQAGLGERVLEMTRDGIDRLEAGVQDVPQVAFEAGTAVFHCWRGGLRSKSVVALLQLCGLDRAACLQGGYKSYRRAVVDEIAAYAVPPMTVIRGNTGAGKTLVLRAIEELRPGWTLDLEGLAGHRSSILGMVGLKPVSQKRFESLLASRLRELPAGAPLIVEGESRRIGDRIQPLCIWEALQAGSSILLEATQSRRIEVLAEDYLASAGSRAELRAQLPFIEQRLGPKRWAGALVALLDADAIGELVGILLELYYDPLYAHSQKHITYSSVLQMDDPEKTAAEIVAAIESAS